MRTNTSYVVSRPHDNVLFDTGPNITDPGTRLRPVSEAFDMRISATDWLVSRLATIGKNRDQISHVVQSHFHFDHAAG
ncbi:MBL fold metallo-hydrolase [Mesorhizobium sp. M0174]|uniref:MBL fold metallo-hydrolase n=1 Tax=Mesorhizobium sp. M0174 TaxID=2956904 RepID=UPI00333C8663